MVFKNKYEWICYNNSNKYKATGRTTRLADDYIQQLFKNIGKWVLVVDHFPIRKATEGLVDIIANRLISEHNIVIEINKILLLESQQELRFQISIKQKENSLTLKVILFRSSNMRTLSVN